MLTSLLTYILISIKQLKKLIEKNVQTQHFFSQVVCLFEFFEKMFEDLRVLRV